MHGWLILLKAKFEQHAGQHVNNKHWDHCANKRFFTYMKD